MTFNPKGKARQWAPATVKELSRVGPGDAAAARNLWRRTVGAKYRPLIDAAVKQ
jgi:hypothetical protein